MDGLRFMDFRVTPKGEQGNERLLAYHGATDERIELGDALSQVYAFLRGVGKRGELELTLLMRCTRFHTEVMTLHACP